NSVVIGTQLLQCANQAIGVSHHPGTGLVSGVLALAGQAQLQQHGRKWRQKEQQEPENTAAAAVTITVTTSVAKPSTQTGSPQDGAGEGRGNRTDKDVIVSDMRKLMGDHAFELIIIHQFQQAFGHGDGSLPAVPALGESVRG